MDTLPVNPANSPIDLRVDRITPEQESQKEPNIDPLLSKISLGYGRPPLQKLLSGESALQGPTSSKMSDLEKTPSRLVRTLSRSVSTESKGLKPVDWKDIPEGFAGALIFLIFPQRLSLETMFRPREAHNEAGLRARLITVGLPIYGWSGGQQAFFEPEIDAGTGFPDDTWAWDLAAGGRVILQADRVSIAGRVVGGRQFEGDKEPSKELKTGTFIEYGAELNYRVVKVGGAPGNIELGGMLSFRDFLGDPEGPSIQLGAQVVWKIW